MKFSICQRDFIVGDLDRNSDIIINEAIAAANDNNDLIIFPELSLTGYLMEDLLYRSDLRSRIEFYNSKIIEATQHLDITIVYGFPYHDGPWLRNAAGALHKGKLRYYFKQKLPNYSVFDEKRYFEPGDTPLIVNVKGVQVGIIVCEDGWFENPAEKAKNAGAELIVSLNASPFEINKTTRRFHEMWDRVTETGLPVVYVNLVGGQDELVFDGASFVINNKEEIYYLDQFIEQSKSFEFKDSDIVIDEIRVINERGTDEKQAYDALVLGVRDYVNKCNSKGIILGLSGGIDSALVLAIAVDALGADRCKAVMMPFEYTSDISKEDAASEAERLGVEYSVIPINQVYRELYNAALPQFDTEKKDVTEENMQARIRGMILMALSNKNGHMVLTTGNKSEMAVGYATLYGDMAGGFDVLKDIPKTLVYRLAKYRNKISEVIPERVIVRPPSAELAPDQTDEKSLCPYDILDKIIELYVEKDYSYEDICYIVDCDAQTIERIIKLIDRNEYKRRQAPPGPKITSRSFGKNRRFPIVNKWTLT